MRNPKVLVLSILLATGAFLGILVMERTIIKITPTFKVVYCIKDIKRKEMLKASDFIEKQIPMDLVSLNTTVKNKAEIEGMYAAEDIYANEILNKNRMGTQAEVISYRINPGEEEFAINFENVADCVGGIIRKDDMVNIYLTNNITSSLPVSKTELKVMGLRVLGAKDSTERYIDKFEKDSSARIILLAGTTQMVSKVWTLQAMGKLRITKASDDVATKAAITGAAIITKVNTNGVIKDVK